MSNRRSHYQQSGPGRFKKRLMIVLGGLAVVAAAAAIRYLPGDETVEAATPTNVQTASASASSQNQAADRGTARQPASASPQDPVAIVNGQTIVRGLLAQECLKHYGNKVIESLTNKYLISLRCQEMNISVGAEEVDLEVERVARRFKIPVDQWVTMLENERGITAEQYKREIIWPTLALKRLAASEMQVTEEEIGKALEQQFGPQVHVRLILVRDKELATQVQQQAAADPESFPKLAREHSTDVNSASAGGLVQPIRRHMGDPTIETAAFALQPGEISQAIPVGDQFAILRCESHIKAKHPTPQQRQQAIQILTDNLRESKLREASATLFQRLQDEAQVVNVYNDPVLRQRMPGVALTINGHQITMAELAETCLQRHGREVLEGQINRALLKAALAERNLSVTQQHIVEEVTRAAKAAGVVTHSGQVHTKEWIKMVTEQQEITEQIYIDDIVWPSVALKLLVADKVEVTAEDMQKAFQANYGERVRCRAIVMNNQRRAQEVWEMTRTDQSVQQFAKLAEQYSIDPSGKAIGGEIPPIQRHGGQPTLETEAFSLQPGEISGVIQLKGATPDDTHYIILLCEGRTKPVVVEMAEVQAELHEDLLEKKFRIVMAGHFQKLRESANVRNFLDPSASSSSKKQSASLSPAAGRFEQSGVQR